MFYSQFILAKKGPLGTIWIAAHLERKLRKNQVADTDIGVSVDSILFPDAPIALRLSSHLLLGVVRIYSKKVNYLFHDCSEALIKIKQAFRSTAVDLPPEESTAPYHSITLPETFDLDNFELPDSAFLDSNFVDHHVSTREQITLQDTVNDNAFPTSKFGLDERFGDGDASQIGLELDEDLFLEKNISQQQDGFSMDSKVSGVHHGETSVPSSSMGIDVQFGYDEEKGRKVPNELSELLSNNYDRNCLSTVVDLRRDVSSHRHGYSIQTPDLNEVFLPDSHTALSPSTPHIPFTPEEAQTPCLMEPAQAPSTPGLLEEVIPSNFQEVPALSPQEKAGICVDSGRSGLCSSPHMEVECTEVGNKSGMASGALGHKSGGTAEEFPPCTSDLIAPTSESLPPIHSNVNLNKIDFVHLVSGAENQQSGLTGEAGNAADHRQGNVEAIFPSGYSHEAANIPSTPNPAAAFETELVTSNTCTDNLAIIGVISDVKGAPLDDNNAPSDIGNLVRLEDGGSCISINTTAVGTDFVLRSCGSNLHPPSSHMVYGALGETSELSNRDHCCNFRTPVREDALNICESSFEVQGGDSRFTNGRVMNFDGQQTLVCMPSVVKSVATKQDDLSTGVLSNFFQLDRVNYSLSSEFVGPDKMLAPACDVSYPNQGLQTACKGVIESHGSIDMTSSHGSRKRHIMDSPATLQTDSSAKLSGIPRSRRNVDYIPDDDDVLASILVGRKAPSLKVGQTTPLSKASSQKRPRTISRLGMPKRRKVLVDDTMVMQADAIRHQLINTEDIRRMRKKAPCTRPEIWRIYMGAMEDEIFYHSALIGISLQLNNLNDEYVQRDPHVKTFGEAVSSRVLEFVNETGDKEKGGSTISMPGIIGEMRGPISDTIPSHEGISLQLNNLNDQYVLQRDPHVKTSGEAVSSRVLEFVNETGDKEKGGSILPMPGIIGEMRKRISDTIPSHEGSAQSNVHDPLVEVLDRPHVKTSGEAVPFSVLEFVNKTGDKEKGGSILPMPGIIGEMRKPISDTIPSHEGSAQSNVHDPLVEVLDRPHVKTSGEAVSFSVLEFVNETGDKEKGGSILSMPGIIGEMRGPISDTIPNHEGSAQSNVHDPLVEVLDRPQAGPLSNDQVAVISSMEADAEADANSIIQETLIPEIDKGASFLEKPDDKSINLAERSAYTEAPNPMNTSNDGSDSTECATIAAINGDSACAAVISETFIQAENVCNAVGTTINEEEKTGNAVDAKYSESNNAGLASDVGTDEVFVTDGSTSVVQGDEAPEQGLRDVKRPITDVACGVRPNIVSFEGSIEHAPSTMGENSYIHKFNLEGEPDVGNMAVDIGAARDSSVSTSNMAVDIGAARDSSDFCSTINDSYTGFLNVDDEPDIDEPENEAPNSENAQSLENSGWSARTRGVARYLKILFDEESGRGRKTIAVDRLLAGKTRKEASRMFFETLVLKTRDYIQVEQEKPFEYINIKPRTKLLASEF